MSPCGSSPPCDCAFHRAQITAFEQWQELMAETATGTQ